MKQFTILDTIGQTPLVKLQRLSPNPDVTILAKCEFFNPSGSIKDRIVKYIIDEAERTGQLVPGGTIVENTSGNTGAAVAMMASIKGYKATLTMPDKVSIEKQNTLKALGAEVIVCPTSAAPNDPEHYVNTARRIASETPNSFSLNQYDNPKNPEAHYFSTGPELWLQTGGNIDYFIASGSTGGTVSGVGKYLKQKNSEIKVIMPDPFGSIYTHYFKTGEIPTEGNCNYYVEGVGEDHIAKAMDFSVVDEMLQFSDHQAFSVANRLATEEGILVGGSAGANVWAAIEIAKRQTSPCTIVTVIPDGGIKYLSKIFNPQWLQEKNILIKNTSNT